MTAQEIYDALDGAFSNFMVADMNNRRCETYMCPDDEATYYAERDGARTGAIIAQVCDDPTRFREAVYQMLVSIRGGLGGLVAVDPVEEREVRMKDMMVYLCGKYQHDEHRRNVRDAFAASCLKAISQYTK